uniref:Uncharacterized protein n=1 Tax=Candidatus Kentrum sp. FW TaxID=2126338 RepID=A0A450SNL7_9GAMM|nr:MAG: hypothetical protein BECKFW1821A_GA0114235_10544 [Candidatus Kentron sp. FW]
MAINTDHVIGFAAGIGAAAVGFYLYKKNQHQVDGWLRAQGIHMPAGTHPDPATLSLEDLVREKERLEDIIAEREMTEQKAED